MKDVAKLAGVSVATVSKYINGITVKERNRVRIADAVKTLDFKVNVIARGLKTNKSMTVGVLIPSLENIFATSIISQIEHVLLQYGYSTIICDYNHDSDLENRKFDFLIRKSVDGIILMPLGISVERIKEAIENGTPVVLIDRPVQGLECDVILVDNINASYNAVEQLIKRGHRRIGIVCGPRNIHTARERLEGYMRVHGDYHITVNDDYVRYGDYGMQSGYGLTEELLDMENPPTAIYVTNYEMTVGAVMAVNERNVKIPDELSMIGFDNQQLAKVVKPNLWIVVQPIREIGELASGTILKRLKGEKSNFPSMIRLKTDLVPGQSISDI